MPLKKRQEKAHKILKLALSKLPAYDRYLKFAEPIPYNMHGLIFHNGVCVFKTEWNQRMFVYSQEYIGQEAPSRGLIDDVLNIVALAEKDPSTQYLAFEKLMMNK